MPARSCSAASAAKNASTPTGAWTFTKSTGPRGGGPAAWPEYLQTRERLRANMRPRGEGGGAAREGAALLQGLVRCGRCGRRMQVSYAGTGGKVRRYACVRGHVLHHTDSACQTLGGGRLDKAVVELFLDAVTPAGVAATAGAIRELEDQHE